MLWNMMKYLCELKEPVLILKQPLQYILGFASVNKPYANVPVTWVKSFAIWFRVWLALGRLTENIVLSQIIDSIP